MASPPLKRVYFDTNILFHWPHIPNNVRSIFGVAKWVGAELYMPTVVESELEARYVREVDAVYGSLASNWKTLDALCHGVIAVDVTGSRPSTDDLRESFRVRSEQLKTDYGLSNIPLTTVTLDTFVDMAINRRAPFEEYEVASRRTQVVGLQDAAILFSIIDHMKTAQEGDRCALVSEDGIFHKAKTRKLLENARVKLQLFKNVRTLFDDLWDCVWEAVRAPWRSEIEQVEANLNEQKDQLAEKIFPLLVASELRQNIWKRAREIKGLRVTEFRSVETELPASEHRPPNAATYARPEGSTVSISARASTQIDAVVETLNLFSLGFLIGQPRAPDEPPPAPKIEDAQLSEALNVSLNGTVRNGVIGDFEVTGVEAARP